MMGRGKSKVVSKDDSSSEGVPAGGGAATYNCWGTNSLIGGLDGVSLDGESVQIDSNSLYKAALQSYNPGVDCGSLRCGDDDDVSSINSSSIIHSGPPPGSAPKVAAPTIAASETRRGDVEYFRATAVSTPVKQKKNHSAADYKPDYKPPAPENDKEIDDDCTQYCCPVWIRRAPSWLKYVLVASVLIILGSMTLLGLGIWGLMSNDENKSYDGSDEDFDRYRATTMLPTHAPPTNVAPSVVLTPTLTPTLEPTQPVKDQPTTQPSKETKTRKPKQSDPTTAPVVNTVEPTEEPTAFPTSSPTFTPAMPVNSTSFVVTGGRYGADTRQDLAQLLSSMPTDGKKTNFVLFHLGDWNSPSTTNCAEYAYTDTASDFSDSSMPVYFVVGDNEYNGTLNV
jgi:hypothetical protein